MKIQDYKEGIYINKNGGDIVEMVFKFTSNNLPFFAGDLFAEKARSDGMSNQQVCDYFMENYAFCCEF